MSIVLQSTGGGSVSIVEPTTASNFTQTLPAVTGTVMVSGNMPAFDAAKSSNQSITSSTFTKVTFDLEQFDTNNNFASNRFTPTVAGYYQITGGIQFSNTTTTWTNAIASIYKNGSEYRRSQLNLTVGAVNNAVLIVTSVVYLNGSTDYVELYGYEVAGGTPEFVGTGSTGNTTSFCGVLVRGA